MGILNDIYDFFINNSSNIIASLVAGVVFFVLGPVLIAISNRKYRRERLNRAKSSYLVLIESMLVNSETISKEKLVTLLSAVNREHQIHLEPNVDLQNILEDLSLRFAKSKHLAPTQKDSYLQHIRTLIDNLNDKNYESELRLPESYERLFDLIDISLKEGNIEFTKEHIAGLKKKIDRERDVYKELDLKLNFRHWYKTMYRRYPRLTGIVTLVIVLIYAILVFYFNWYVDL